MNKGARGVGSPLDRVAPARQAVMIPPSFRSGPTE